MRSLMMGPHSELTLTGNLDTAPGAYAILSHTWYADSEEVTLDDLQKRMGMDKKGYEKTLFLANQAKKDGFAYL